VLSGSKVMSSALAATQDVTTLEGSSLTVTKTGSVVKAGSATVGTADLACSNGVIHVIDAVLLPPIPSTSGSSSEASSDSSQGLSIAVNMILVVKVLARDCPSSV